MDVISELTRILREYREDVAGVEANKRVFDGFMGMGKAPSADACHDRMDRAVAQLPAGLAEGEAPDGLVEAVLKAEKETAGLPEYARLSLIAAQRHCLPLIQSMTPRAREALREWYLAAYPRRVRLPLQRAIIKALEGR